MISHRKADLLDEMYSQQFPGILIGKKLIFFPCGMPFKMGFEIRGWEDGKILKENQNYRSDDYTKHALGVNTKDRLVYTPPIYTEANFFGIRDGYAFFKNNQQHVEGKKAVMGKKGSPDKQELGKIVGFSDGLVHTESGIDIYPEKVSCGYMNGSSDNPNSILSCRLDS